jgi:3-hydroxyacyl-[acyl-carrier-protein] dehydratase
MHSVSKEEFDDPVSIGIEEIKELLPHRYPFLLVDKITALTPGKHAVGIKGVTINEPFFQGHFPEKAVMPGVLVIEAMAQVGGIMMLSMKGTSGMLAYLASIDQARFRKPVVPGDILESETTILRIKGTMGKAACVSRVDGQVVAEATILFALVKP